MGEAGEEHPIVRCLSFHSRYSCRNSGVCCSSGWEIAVEQDVEVRLFPRLLADSKRLPNGPDGFRQMADPPGNCRSSLRRSEATGSCWFRDVSAQRCAIHREFGEAALPSACRQFPRVCVLEPRIVSLSLSHYCPTAAGLLFDERAGFDVVTGPIAFPADWPFEGLDAREAYPPFLRPGVLLGFDGLRAFEDEAVRALSNAVSVWDGLSDIAAAVNEIRSWRVSLGPLPEFIHSTFARSLDRVASTSPGPDPRAILLASVNVTEGASVGNLPDFPATTPHISPRADLVLRKYLASRLIAGWVMFQAEDLGAIPRYLRLCLDTVLLFEAATPPDAPELTRWKEAIRSADLWLLHHCDPERLVRNLR